MHLTGQELHRWRDHGRPEDRARVVDHLAVCDACGRRCAELVRTRPAASVARRFTDWRFAIRGRRLLAAGGERWERWRPRAFAPAALVLALAASWIALQSPPGTEEPLREPPVTAIRGGELQALSPTGAVTPPFSFRWASPYAAVRFRVVISDENGPVYTALADGERLDLTPELMARLLPGTRFQWTVTALDSAGTAIAASAPQAFSVR